VKSREQITEDGLWAVAVIRVWAECPQLHLEFDSICDFEVWVHDVAESLIRSAGNIDQGKE
jgi:hypothetical protein